MIEVEMNYTKQNLQTAFKLHYKKMFPVRGRILQVLGVLLIWTGILLIIIYRNNAHQVVNFAYIVVGLFFIGLHSYLMSNLGKFTFRRIKNPEQTFNFKLAEDKIYMSAADSNVFIEWPQVQKAILDKDIIIIYVSKLQFYFLPKENFKEGEFEQATELVRSKVTTIAK